MKVVNISGCALKDSQFDEIKISRYYRNMFQNQMAPILQMVNANRLTDDQVLRLVRTVVEADKNNAGKVVISFSILKAVRLKIAKAFLLAGYDTYSATLDGVDCVWIDPREAL